MAHKRDLYLIPNQTDILDCWIKVTVFSSLYFFLFTRWDGRKFNFTYCSRDFNTEISKSHVVPDKLANDFHVHLVQLVARYCNQKSLLKAKLSSHFNQTLAKSAASVLRRYIISEICYCDFSSVLEGKQHGTT